MHMKPKPSFPPVLPPISDGDVACLEIDESMGRQPSLDGNARRHAEIYLVEGVIPMVARSAPSETELVQLYLPIVERVANDLARHKPHFMDRQDLVQDGLTALLQALRSRSGSYTEEQFCAYAYRRIYGAVIDSFRQHSPVSRGNYRKARQTQMAAAMDSGSVAATKLQRADDFVNSVYLHANHIDEEFYVADLSPGPEIQAAARRDLEKVFAAMAGIPEYKRTVLIQCAIYEESQVEMSLLLNISQSRVSQILKEVRGILEKVLLSRKSLAQSVGRIKC